MRSPPNLGDDGPNQGPDELEVLGEEQVLVDALAQHRDDSCGMQLAIALHDHDELPQLLMKRGVIILALLNQLENVLHAFRQFAATPLRHSASLGRIAQ